MRTTFHELKDFTVWSTDGELGKIKDVYFDDAAWQIRYLVVDTHKWLPGRKVLIAPESVSLVDAKNAILRLKLTRTQVENSPPIYDHLPVTRQEQMHLHDFFGWNHYWITGGVVDFQIPTANYGPIIEKAEIPDELQCLIERRSVDDASLQSYQDLRGFNIRSAANDEAEMEANAPRRIGHVHDIVMNYVEWIVPYFIVDTGEFLPGRKVILPTAIVAAIDVERHGINTYAKPDILSEVPDFEGIERLDEQCERATLGYYLGRFRLENEQRGTTERSVRTPSASMPEDGSLSSHLSSNGGPML